MSTIINVFWDVMSFILTATKWLIIISATLIVLQYVLWNETVRGEECFTEEDIYWGETENY